MFRRRPHLPLVVLLALLGPAAAQAGLPAVAAGAELELLAAGLANPRGVALLPDGGLLVAEAGTGDHDGAGRRSGRLLVLRDGNGDGRLDGPGERRVLLDGQLSYNGLTVFGTGRDEVGGLGDVLLAGDEAWFTKDDPFAGYAADGDHRDLGVGVVPLAGGPARLAAKRPATVNGLARDARTGRLYAAESGSNRLLELRPDGTARVVAAFGPLAHGQQAVPAGLALDPTTGELLVALFSGVIYDYGGDRLSYWPGDAKVVRVDPESGLVADEIAGLTTAVDVAVDERGTVYALELATAWPAARMPPGFDLTDPDGPPDAGGYPRFSGRLTAHPADGAPVVLVRGLDAPTHLTWADGALYVSTGQGTPGRPIVAPDGPTRIDGRVWRLEPRRP